jgi:uncharacterized membrane protein YuzA (DUF378 family)
MITAKFGIIIGEKYLTSKKGVERMDRLSLLLVVIGALNWGLVGLFRFDLIAAIFGGANSIVSRFIYTLVGLAGAYAISFFFREREKTQ